MLSNGMVSDRTFSDGPFDKVIVAVLYDITYTYSLSRFITFYKLSSLQCRCIYKNAAVAVTIQLHNTPPPPPSYYTTAITVVKILYN